MADFVTVMGIAKRYYKHTGIIPNWFELAFHATSVCKESDFETAQRNLLAWAAEHPDTTEQKEDKTVESKRTRVHELLGVEPFQRFGVKNHECEEFVDGNGALWIVYPTRGVEELLKSNSLAKLINDPSLILRRPTLTDEQREVLSALKRLRFGYVATDSDGDVFAYMFEPELNGEQWLIIDEADPYFYSESLDCLRPLIPDWTQPLDIEKTLKEAGVNI